MERSIIPLLTVMAAPRVRFLAAGLSLLVSAGPDMPSGRRRPFDQLWRAAGASTTA